ncbi:uncharacterized protein BDV14DRAFT_171104 [Aspergillus stella-maris]|uniref:uncharacterized protein n=1 Tax=Aspergillus stella-maris TaxID=1810926 RepID=UPI003CCCB6AF
MKFNAFEFSQTRASLLHWISDHFPRRAIDFAALSGIFSFLVVMLTHNVSPRNFIFWSGCPKIGLPRVFAFLSLAVSIRPFRASMTGVWKPR